jgi:hypothetical protein
LIKSSLLPSARRAMAEHWLNIGFSVRASQSSIHFKLRKS